MKRREITERCRELRKRMTQSEKILWEVIRNRQLEKFKFLRQYPIIYYEVNDRTHFYIADFYCHHLRLVIEVDGPIHNYQLEEDNDRDLVMKEMKLHVLRIKNEELLQLNDVLQKIILFIKEIEPIIVK